MFKYVFIPDEKSFEMEMTVSQKIDLQKPFYAWSKKEALEFRPYPGEIFRKIEPWRDILKRILKYILEK